MTVKATCTSLFSDYPLPVLKAQIEAVLRFGLSTRFPLQIGDSLSQLGVRFVEKNLKMVGSTEQFLQGYSDLLQSYSVLAMQVPDTV